MHKAMLFFNYFRYYLTPLQYFLIFLHCFLTFLWCFLNRLRILMICHSTFVHMLSVSITFCLSSSPSFSTILDIL